MEYKKPHYRNYKDYPDYIEQQKSKLKILGKFLPVYDKKYSEILFERLKRDGNLVIRTDFSTRTDGFSHAFVMGVIGTLTVGDSVTFSLTADNVTDTDTITVDRGILMFLNSPRVLDAAIPATSPPVVFDDIIRPGGGGFK